jgi:membrane-bound metal-dependent hydrolase YbcI (DUF457 family)
MPDWFTHTLAGWITGKTTKMDIGLVIIGSLIPDLMKVTIAFKYFGIDHYNLFNPIHTPIGACLIAGLIALFFKDAKKAFIALGIGITTHFILDFMLFHSSGMKLLFPFSWEEWRYLCLIHASDYWITIIAIAITILIYTLYTYHDKRKNRKEQRI